MTNQSDKLNPSYKSYKTNKSYRSHWTYKSYFLLFCAAGALLLASPAEAGIKPPPSNLGLVGYWSMDDCRSAKATDFSGSGNTGSLTNFALSTSTSNWVTGNAAKRGCALDFDGSNDYVETPNNTWGITATGTISLWIKTTQTTVAATVFSLGRGDSYNDEFGIILNYPTANKIGVFQDKLSGNYTYRQSDTTINTGAWFHVVGVMSGTGTSNMKIYINGVQETGSAATVGSPTELSDTLARYVRIGSRVTTHAYFSGSVDDVRIYNRALSATEVTALYNSGSAKLTAPSNTGLVGYWSFEDGRGSKATDFSGSGNAGTLTNFALSTSTSNWNTGNACKRGTCLNFDGTNDYVGTGDVLDGVFVGANKKFSISAWVKQDASTTTKVIVSKLGDGASGGNERQFYFGPSNSKVLFIYYGDLNGNSYRGFQADTTPITPGNWYHAVATYDGTLAYNSRVTITINGIAQSLSIPYSEGSPDAIQNGAAQLAIGAAVNLQTAYQWNGSLDDVRIYNRALSATEVASLYQSGLTKINASTAQLQQGTSLASGLVGHWTFDGQYLTTTTSTDTSGSGNNGTLTGGPVPTPGRLGQALSFDGVDDCVLAAGTAGGYTNSQSHTYAFWMYPTNVSDTYNWAFYGGSTSLILASNHPRFFYNAGSSYVIDTLTTIALNTWYHVVASYDATTNKVTFYVNGLPTTTSGALGTWTSSGGSDVGSYSGCPGSNYFNGSLDDVRVYSRALSANEVQQLYNLGR